MTIAAYVALFGWVPAILVLFALLPSRRAATVAVIVAWLLLPPYGIPITGFPDYSKNTAATLGMILGTLFFAPDRILAFRPRWFDLPMLLWCLCGIATSLHNNLGPYDGLSDAPAPGYVLGTTVPAGSNVFQRFRWSAQLWRRHDNRRTGLRPPMPLGDPDEPPAFGGHLRSFTLARH